MGQLELGWRAGLRRLPFFTQRTAVLLVGVLVASLAPESRPGPGTAAPGDPAAGHRSGAAADHPPAPTTTTTNPPGPLDPADDLLGPVVSTLLA